MESVPELKAAFASWNWDSGGQIATRYEIVEDRQAEDRRSGAERLYNLFGWVTVKDELGHEFDLVNIYLPSVRSWFNQFVVLNRGGMAQFHQDRFEKLTRIVDRLTPMTRPTLVTGDLNMPRDAPLMGRLLTDFQEAFAAAGWGTGNTFPASLPWLSLDHILVDRQCWRVASCEVTGKLGSDHRAVVARVDLQRLRPELDWER